MKPSAGLLGVDGVLVVTISPESSSNATTSVNVPPVSIPILIRRCAMGEIQPVARPPRLGTSCQPAPVEAVRVVSPGRAWPSPERPS